MSISIFNSNNSRIKVQSKDDLTSEDVLQVWTSVHRSASLSRRQLQTSLGEARMYRRLSISKPQERNG